MARSLRLEYAGAYYHLINRGNDRRNIFEGKGAAAEFERVLDECAIRFSWEIHAYVVMRNHFHLAVRVTEPNLSVGMKWLQGTWARRYKGYRKLVGKPFQGRFKSLVVEPGHAFAQVCHYIHLNPIRAGLVTCDQIESYGASSAATFQQKNRPTWLLPKSVLASAGNLPDTAQGWRSYKRFLQVLRTDKISKQELSAAKLSRGWCIGGAKFKAEMRKKAASLGESFERGRSTGRALQAEKNKQHNAWENRLQWLARLAGVDLKNLPEPKSAPEKARLAAAMKQSTSVSNRWLAERLKMGEAASASQFAGRWMLKATQKKAVEALLLKIKT